MLRLVQVSVLSCGKLWQAMEASENIISVNTPNVSRPNRPGYRCPRSSWFIGFSKPYWIRRVCMVIKKERDIVLFC